MQIDDGVNAANANASNQDEIFSTMNGRKLKLVKVITTDTGNVTTEWTIKLTGRNLGFDSWWYVTHTGGSIIYNNGEPIQPAIYALVQVGSQAVDLEVGIHNIK